MSKETAEWLNTQTLIGFTEKRGKAWHYQEALQGEESNSYEGPVPVEDVERRLFNWEAVSVPLTYEYNGKSYVTERQIIIRSDSGADLGVFKGGYRAHDYNEWLVRNVSTILDDGLAIGSAGLLKNGGQAWVSVEVPENITTPEGVEFRPNLVAATSLDGSLSTTYARTVTNVVCDNTLAAGLDETGQKLKFRHTKYSNLDKNVQSARDALQVVYKIADDFAAEVEALCAQVVRGDQFIKVLDKIVPMDDKDGRGLTLAENKRDKIAGLYAHDVRVAPWAGTSFGVLQAFNTYNHHYATIKGASRTQRNREAAITGSIMDKDAAVLDALELVLAN